MADDSPKIVKKASEKTETVFGFRSSYICGRRPTGGRNAGGIVDVALILGLGASARRSLSTIQFCSPWIGGRDSISKVDWESALIRKHAGTAPLPRGGAVSVFRQSLLGQALIGGGATKYGCCYLPPELDVPAELLPPGLDDPPEVDVKDFDGPPGLVEVSDGPPEVDVRESGVFPGLIEVSKEPGRLVVLGGVTGFEGMLGV